MATVIDTFEFDAVKALFPVMLQRDQDRFIIAYLDNVSANRIVSIDVSPDGVIIPSTFADIVFGSGITEPSLIRRGGNIFAFTNAALPGVIGQASAISVLADATFISAIGFKLFTGVAMGGDTPLIQVIGDAHVVGFQASPSLIASLASFNIPASGTPISALITQFAVSGAGGGTIANGLVKVNETALEGVFAVAWSEDFIKATGVANIGILESGTHLGVKITFPAGDLEDPSADFIAAGVQVTDFIRDTTGLNSLWTVGGPILTNKLRAIFFAGNPFLQVGDAYTITVDPPALPSGLNMQDESANFVAAGIEPGDILLNNTDGSVWRVNFIGFTILTCSVLSSGIDDTWEEGDSYTIFQRRNNISTFAYDPVSTLFTLRDKEVTTVQTGASGPKLLEISTGVFAAVWQEGPKAALEVSPLELDSSIILRTFAISPTGIITPIDGPVLIDENSNQSDHDIQRVGVDLYAIAFRNTSGQGLVKTVTISSIGDISGLTPIGLVFELVEMARPSIASRVSDFTFVIAYTGPDQDGFVKTIELAAIPTETGFHNGAAGSVDLVDPDANFVGAGVQVGDLVQNTKDSGSPTAVITAVTSDTITALLASGDDEDWDIGDSYKVSKIT